MNYEPYAMNSKKRTEIAFGPWNIVSRSSKLQPVFRLVLQMDLQKLRSV